MTFSEIKEKIISLELSQYANSPKAKALIEDTVEQLRDLDDDTQRLAKFASMEEATAGWLDLLGQFRNVTRKSGESDTTYKARIAESFGVNDAGTPAYAIRMAAKNSGDSTPHYFDELPGVFFIYTPNGRQLARRTVQKTAPAGVLGLPGAAITTATGARMTEANGKKILAVADDANIQEYGEIQIVTGDDEHLVDAEGNIITGYTA